MNQDDFIVGFVVGAFAVVVICIFAIGYYNSEGNCIAWDYEERVYTKPYLTSLADPNSNRFIATFTKDWAIITPTGVDVNLVAKPFLMTVCLARERP